MMYSQSNYSYTRYLQPPLWTKKNPAELITTKFVHTSINKNKCPVFCIRWTSDGRRLITGTQRGEFTVWNGQQFNFINVQTAHSSAVRCMSWSRSGVYLLSGEERGLNGGKTEIKYFNTSLSPVNRFGAHDGQINEITFSPTDRYFASCSDDKTVCLWDFSDPSSCVHKFEIDDASPVKSVDWHPTESILLAVSKGTLTVIDSRTNDSVQPSKPHIADINKVRWNKNGNWFLTSSKDCTIKLHDIRMLKKELMTFKRHDKDVPIVSWHPYQEDFFVSGGANGLVCFWDIQHSSPIGEIPIAHDGAIWDLQWHPVGHLLASCSHDQTTKFWCRDRPGDTLDIKKYQGTNREYDPINPMTEDIDEVNYDAPCKRTLLIPGEEDNVPINGLDKDN